MDLLDPYIAEKVVAHKQDELRAEAKESALRSAMVRESGSAAHRQWIRAVRSARVLLRLCATVAWREGVNGATPLGEADR